MLRASSHFLLRTNASPSVPVTVISRSYIFLPSSFQEVQTTVRTWLGKKAKERTIWVKLLRDRYRSRVKLWRDKYSSSRSRIRARLRPVQLTEFSKPHWFDANGYPLTARDESGRFVNPWSSESTNGSHPVWDFIRWRLERLRVWNKKEIVPVRPIPVEFDDTHNAIDHLSLTWIGHSTCLVRLSGYTLLTDPIFSQRASPVQWIPVGVPRHVQPACRVDDLPPVIDVVLLSHDHYDHLDKTSCMALKDRVVLWAVPLNIKAWLVTKCGIDPTKIVELKWWQRHTLSTQHRGIPLTLTCAPAQHWGSRTMLDRNSRLWCSWAASSPTRNFYFAGDTGYPAVFPLFWQIGDALGPFDLAAIPIGAYAPAWFMADSHVNPSEALAIHEQVRSRTSVAIHWGTFTLAEEDDAEPPRWLKEEAAATQQDFRAVVPGTTVYAPGSDATRSRSHGTSSGGGAGSRRRRL
jgi:N-acyl-phosphatidylethanolamine-hydrolysing phospholipase D